MTRTLSETEDAGTGSVGILDLTSLGRKLDRFHRLAGMVAGMEMHEAARKGVKPAELLALKAGNFSEIEGGRVVELIGMLKNRCADTRD